MDERVVRGALLGGALVVLAYASMIEHGALPGSTFTEFPVHLDEYVHWGYAKATAESGTTQFGDPFHGDPQPPGVVTISQRGFHAYLASFQQVSGLDWPTLFLVEPVAVACLLGLAAYVAMHRWGAGVFAVVLLAAVPTSVRFLGFGYVVPVAFALPFLVLGADALFRLDETSLVPYAILAAALWLIHPMPAVTLVIIAFAYTLLSGRRADRRLVIAGVVTLAALAAAWPVYERYIKRGIHAATLPTGIEEYRAALVLLLAGGAALLVIARDTGLPQRAGFLALGLVAAALEGVLILRFETGLDPFSLYDRSFLVVHVLSVLLAAVLLARLWRSGLAMLASRRRVAATALLAFALVTPTLVVARSWDEQADESHYTMLTPAKHQAYLDAAASIDRRAPRAIVDSIHSMAFTDVTGVPTLFVFSPSGGGAPREAQIFFGKGANDTAYLLATRTTIVVTDRAVENGDLERLAPGVYQLKPELVDRIVAP